MTEELSSWLTKNGKDLAEDKSMTAKFAEVAATPIPPKTTDETGFTKQLGDHAAEQGKLPPEKKSAGDSEFASPMLLAAALDASKGTSVGSLLEKQWLPKNPDQQYLIENLQKARMTSLLGPSEHTLCGRGSRGC